jgi:hypothetical protein
MYEQLFGKFYFTFVSIASNMFEQKLRNVGLGQWLDTQIYHPKIKGLNPGREKENGGNQV